MWASLCSITAPSGLSVTTARPQAKAGESEKADAPTVDWTCHAIGLHTPSPYRICPLTSPPQQRINTTVHLAHYTARTTCPARIDHFDRLPASLLYNTASAPYHLHHPPCPPSVFHSPPSRRLFPCSAPFSLPLPSSLFQVSSIPSKYQEEWNGYVKQPVDEQVLADHSLPPPILFHPISSSPVRSYPLSPFQANVFLKAFVADFQGKRFEEVLDVAQQFGRYISPTSPTGYLEEAIAHQFLEKRGETVTATELRNQLRIIDVDNQHRLSFLEYALFKFKKTPGEFFTDLHNPSRGGGEALRQAIEEYRAVLKARDERSTKMAALEATAAAGGVKGMAAKNQLAQMQQEDQLALNKAEITSAANKRKAEKNAVDPYEEEQKKQAEEKAKRDEEEKKKKEEARGRLAAKAAMFNGGK